MYSPQKLVINNEWSNPIAIPKGYNVKVKFGNNNFEIETVDLNFERTRDTTKAYFHHDSLILGLDHFDSKYNLSLIFKTLETEEFEIEYEFWVPG